MILACPSVSVCPRDLALVLPPPRFAGAPTPAPQASRVAATLEGIVHRTRGDVIPNSKVTLRNPLTNQSRTVTTDEQGFFRADQLAIGTYEVRVEQTGFAPYRQAGVGTSLGQTVHLDIVLAPASASAQMTGNSQPSSLD